MSEQRIVYAHADLELRKRFAKRDEHDHGKQAAPHGFHYNHKGPGQDSLHLVDNIMVAPSRRKSEEVTGEGVHARNGAGNGKPH